MPNLPPSDEQVTIGRVVATESFPSGPHRFHFWTGRDTPIGIGALVRVEGADRKEVFAMVIDGVSFANLESPLDDVSASLKDFGVDRTEVYLWTAAVLRQVPDEPMQPVPLAPVQAARPSDVPVALRMDAFAGGESSTGIPVGIYRAGGLNAPVSLDLDFLLGPESAHLNISGVSGLATKTSAVEFLLSSVFQTFPESKGTVAAVCFNVKGPDLLYLDQSPELSEEDLEMYQRLGLEPKPFERIRYYAPFKGDGINLNTLRTHPDLIENMEPLVWGLKEVLDFHEVLLTREDIDAKADALIDFLSERVVEKEFRDDWGGVHHVTTFADLERFFRAIFDGLEAQGRGDIWRTHHVATIRKIRNRLLNISTRCKGLVTDDGTVNDLPLGDFEDRAVYAIDVAGMDQLAQDLVFTRVVSKLREHLERRDLGVDHVIVFVDELNKYAPSDGFDTYVRRMLLDISERGRYLGLVLFGVQQFRSQIHRRVIGNAGTLMFGRTDMDELATSGYQVFSGATKSKLATLPKGELMIRHPHFTQPVFVKFPKPPVLSGRDGMRRFPPAPEVPFEEAVLRQLVALDSSIPQSEVRDEISGREELDVRRALLATKRARPQNVLAYFRARLGRRYGPEPPLEAPTGSPGVRDLEDPYAF